MLSHELQKDYVKTKNKWTKPLLTVLCRGKNEEAVLTSCKSDTIKHGPDSPPCHSASPDRCVVAAAS